MVAFVCLAADAEAAAPAGPEADRRCSVGSWELRNAASLPNERGSAALNPEWSPLLDEAAACVRELPYACLEVEGRFDELAFSHEVVTAFGGAAAAQQARARGRAAAVLERLAGLGVPSAKLREQTPSSQASFRGALIRLERECLPRPASLTEEDRRTIEDARRLLEANRERAAAQETAAVVELPESAPLYFLEAGGVGGVGVADSATTFSPGLRIAFGIQPEKVRARVGLGMSVNSREAQQAGIELLAAGGLQLLPWLEVGARFGGRFGSVELGATWLERSWYAGVEAHQCILPLNRKLVLCLQQAVLPIGGQTRRAQVVPERQIQRIQPTSESYSRYELGVVLRHDLALGTR